MSSPSDLRALAEFRHRLRLFLAFSEREARAAGLEPQQHQFLLALKGLPLGKQPNIRTLSERLQIRHHSAVEMVDRLAARGLVVRCRSTSDRREIRVELTAAGERVLLRLSRAHRAELRTAGPFLLQPLKTLLRKGKIP